MNKIDEIELYDLNNDISESKNVADQHPKIVLEIKSLADEMRKKLGDKLLNIKGTENRPAGSVE
jgi:arylsulfatase